MLLAWRDPGLQQACKQQGPLDTAAGPSADDVRALLTAVVASEPFGVLLRFRSVQVALQAGSLDLTMGNARVRVRLLSADGLPIPLAASTDLREHASVNALVIDDLVVQGHPLLQRAG